MLVHGIQGNRGKADTSQVGREACPELGCGTSTNRPVHSWKTRYMADVQRGLLGPPSDGTRTWSLCEQVCSSHSVAALGYRRWMNRHTRVPGVVTEKLQARKSAALEHSKGANGCSQAVMWQHSKPWPGHCMAALGHHKHPKWHAQATMRQPWDTHCEPTKKPVEENP